MPDTHPATPSVLIPFAACSAAACRATLATLALPHFERLLRRLSPDPTADAGEIEAQDEYTLTPPHERALARRLGLATTADGGIPWAALDPAHADGTTAPTNDTPAHIAWAYITPCHWHIAADHISMEDPRQLQLDAAASRRLMALMQPYFAEDGITLDYLAPTRWLARGDAFRDLASASLDRVIGRDVDIWMPDATRARPLRRLQSEMQMLLYNDPFNDERAARGWAPVNSFWISGSGALSASEPVTPATSAAATHIPRTLADAALAEDWRGWAAAWQALDADLGARLLQALDAGHAVALTLCGERHARSWQSAPRSAWQRLHSQFKHLISPLPLSRLLEQL